MISKRTICHIICIVALLLIGALVYFFYKPSLTLYEQWLGITKNAVPMAIANWLPDFCWCYALLLTMKLIWYNWEKVPFVWKLFCWVMPIASEYFQWLKILPGTADLWDAGVYMIAYLLIELRFLPFFNGVFKYSKLILCRDARLV